MANEKDELLLNWVPKNNWVPNEKDQSAMVSNEIFLIKLTLLKVSLLPVLMRRLLYDHIDIGDNAKG